MIRYLSLNHVLIQQQMVINASGGKHGFKDIAGVDSAVAQPQMTFDGEDLYPSISEKAAVLAFSLIKNHGFTDGNKRIGYAAMRAFLRRNGYDRTGSRDEWYDTIISLAASEMGREDFTEWVVAHTKPLIQSHDQFTNDSPGQ